MLRTAALKKLKILKNSKKKHSSHKIYLWNYTASPPYEKIKESLLICLPTYYSNDDVELKGWLRRILPVVTSVHLLT